MRTKAYLHLISLWRSFRDAILRRHNSRRHNDASAEASPFLIYAAVVLAVLLAILQIETYRSELESLGFLGHFSIEAHFLSP